MTATIAKEELLALTAKIVGAHVARNSVAAAELPNLITQIHASLAMLGDHAPSQAVGKLVPAVSVRQSIQPDYLVCLEDGRRLKTLKRHLRVAYGLTPDAYRAKWNLPSDYPMVAPAYREQRSALARKIGLGSKGGRPSRRRAV